MNTEYLLACGVVWRSTADPEAGWELVESLESQDPRLRVLAQAFLVEGGLKSMELLEEALAAGMVSTERVGPCMVEILFLQQARARSEAFYD